MRSKSPGAVLKPDQPIGPPPLDGETVSTDSRTTTTTMRATISATVGNETVANDGSVGAGSSATASATITAEVVEVEQLSFMKRNLNNFMLGSLMESMSITATVTKVPDPQPAKEGGEEIVDAGLLAPMAFSMTLGLAMTKFVSLIAKYWVDEHGYGPLGRFLKFDKPIGGIGPTRRIVLFLIVGFLLSIIALVLTEDEYYSGPKLDLSRIEMGEEKTDFYPVYISFENLGCYVQNVGQVIANISGDARPGRLVGVLGASGSGKTTLAHALLGWSRRTCTISTGSVYLNGEPGSLDSFLDRVGFVPQDDVLYPELTVYETLLFAARWRLPRYLSEKAIEDIIKETMETLNLAHLADHYVGGPKKRGLSGGERKRVSIGVELVALPSVLVLDEPTSGLDGAQAHKLISTLKFIASRFNVSVITVIHQPSSRSFSLLDDLILLQKGRLVYYGERAQAMSYFSSMPSLQDYFKQVAKSNESIDALSPAEILLDVSTGFMQLESDFTASEFFRNRSKDIREREKHYRIATTSLLVEDEAEFEHQRSLMKERCGGYRSELLRALCNIRSGLLSTMGFGDGEVPRLKYSKRAKRGIFFQSFDWWLLLWKLTFRRGIKIEVSSIIILAGTCAYLRHFNRSWQRKQIASFYISVSLGMVAMMGAALEDDILPVRRAVNSGMLMGAHEFALVMHSLNRGFFLTHLFTFCFFLFRYCFDPPLSAIHAGQQREFVCTPFSLRAYLRFHHLAQINYYAARGFGMLITVLVDHDEKKSLIACSAFLVGSHAFSLFSPQMSQLVKDGLVVFGFNFAKPMLFLCSFSYVRYFLEAMYLWDPDPTDRVGRDFTMRYYSYHDGTEAACATTIVGLVVASQVVRFILFAFKNANDFASFYDAPAFIIFVAKILAVYGLLLVVAIIFHEFGGIKNAWDASIGVALKNRRTSMQFSSD